MLVAGMELKSNKVVWLLCIFVAVLNCGTIRRVGADRTAISQTHTDRILAERVNSSGTSALTLRTQRVDPLDDLKKYRGGYNITNKHYWSSAVFTGKFGYIVAGIWIVSGLIYGAILLILNIFFHKRRRALYQKNRRRLENNYSFWLILLGILFTLLAIVASGVALGGSTRFHSRAKAIKNIIVGAANEASGTIHNVTVAVQSIQDITEAYSRFDVSRSLNSTIQRLSFDADNIRRKADKSMRRLNQGLKVLRVLTIITVSLNLVAIFALLVAASRPLRLRRIFRMLIILSWIFTFLFWLYFGLYYFLNKFAGDTCAALNEYKQDPRNSTLSSILPCNNQASAKRALREVGAGIHGLVDQVNANISKLQTLSISGIEYVCNPFSGPPDYNYQQDDCPSNTIRIKDIPQILKAYACSTENCKGGEFISSHDYDIAVTGINSIQMILDSYPGMKNLVDCGSVKDAFSKILSTECKPMKKYVHMSWAAFATLSTVMSILLLVWMVVARRDSKYRSLDGSVKPDHSEENDSDGIVTTPA